jgi:hypothetical protein
LVIGFSSGEGESMAWFFGVMMSCAIIITIVSAIMPGIMYRKSINASPDAIIATNGMYYMGQLHTWNSPLIYIKNIKIDEDKNELVFTLKYFTKIGWYKYETYSVNIPIPEGEMKKAQEVINRIRN